MVTICYIYPLIHVNNKVLKKRKIFLHSVIVSEHTDPSVKFLINFVSLHGWYWILNWEISIFLHPSWIDYEKGWSFEQNFSPNPNFWWCYCINWHEVGWHQLCTLVPGGRDVYLGQGQTRIYKWRSISTSSDGFCFLVMAYWQRNC